jgi:rhodanese-related sulfurtransferase
MVEELSPTEVEDLLDDDVQIVDIRSPSEFEQGHIPGAINVPMAELPARIDEIDWGDHVVCACPLGQSSVQAANLIRSYEGVSDDAVVASMAGGYREWEGDLETGPATDRSDA